MLSIIIAIIIISIVIVIIVIIVISIIIIIIIMMMMMMMMMVMQHPDDRMTHNEARESCLQQGGRLASLASPTQWTLVTRLLWATYRFDVVVGITSNFGGLPAM